MFFKIYVLKTSQNAQENTNVRVSFLIETWNFIKTETPTQVFSSGIFKFFKLTTFAFYIYISQYSAMEC